MAKALLTDGLLSTLPAADACPADLCMVGKLLTAPAFCLPVSAEEGSTAPVQKQGADGNKILLIAGQGVVFLYNVCNKPQIVPDELFAGRKITGTQGGEGGFLLPGVQRPRKAAALQMKRQNQKLCGKNCRRDKNMPTPPRSIINGYCNL